MVNQARRLSLGRYYGWSYVKLHGGLHRFVKFKTQVWYLTLKLKTCFLLLQVVNENSISSANKPSSKGSSSDVLVRLYGSCILWVVLLYILSSFFFTSFAFCIGLTCSFVPTASMLTFMVLVLSLIK